LALQRGHSPRLVVADTHAEVERDLVECRQILVAEDNEVNQLVISAMMAQLGHCCDVARDGLEVVAMVAASTYHIVLMDILMPDLDGLAAALRIRARHRSRSLR